MGTLGGQRLADDGDGQRVDLGEATAELLGDDQSGEPAVLQPLAHLGVDVVGLVRASSDVADGLRERPGLALQIRISRRQLE